MKKRKRIVWTSLLAIFCAASASATPIIITGSGTFTSSTPSTTFSGPSQPWAFSFLVDSNPVVSNVIAGGAFDPAYSNFSYSLNGAPVAITPVELRFFNASSTGMLALCFTAACGITSSGVQFAGPQMYSGAESSPTILTGAFASTTFVAYVGTTLSFQPNVTLQAATIPEPAISSLMVAGFLGMGLLRRYRKHY